MLYLKKPLSQSIFFFSEICGFWAVNNSHSHNSHYVLISLSPWIDSSIAAGQIISAILFFLMGATCCFRMLSPTDLQQQQWFLMWRWLWDHLKPQFWNLIYVPLPNPIDSTAKISLPWLTYVQILFVHLWKLCEQNSQEKHLKRTKPRSISSLTSSDAISSRDFCHTVNQCNHGLVLSTFCFLTNQSKVQILILRHSRRYSLWLLLTVLMGLISEKEFSTARHTIFFAQA